MQILFNFKIFKNHFCLFNTYSIILNKFILRKENGIVEPIVALQSPCTPEILRLACEDDLVRKSKVTPKQLDCFDKESQYEKLWAVRS